MGRDPFWPSSALSFLCSTMAEVTSFPYRLFLLEFYSSKKIARVTHVQAWRIRYNKNRSRRAEINSVDYANRVMKVRVVEVDLNTISINNFASVVAALISRFDVEMIRFTYSDQYSGQVAINAGNCDDFHINLFATSARRQSEVLRSIIRERYTRCWAPPIVNRIYPVFKCVCFATLTPARRITLSQ